MGPFLPSTGNSKKKKKKGDINSPKYTFKMTQTHDFKGAKKLQTKCNLTYREAQREQGHLFHSLLFFPLLLLSTVSTPRIKPSCSTDMISTIWQIRSFPSLLRRNAGSVTGRTWVPRGIPPGYACVRGHTHIATSIKSRQCFPSRSGLQALFTVSMSCPPTPVSSAHCFPFWAALPHSG